MKKIVRNDTKKEILVSIFLNGKNMKVGRLLFCIKNNKVSALFEHDRQWLNNSEIFALEPALKITAENYMPEPALQLSAVVKHKMHHALISI